MYGVFCEMRNLRMIQNHRYRQLAKVKPVAPYRLDPFLLGRIPAWWKPIQMTLLYAVAGIICLVEAVPLIVFLLLGLGLVSFVLRTLGSILGF